MIDMNWLDIHHKKMKRINNLKKRKTEKEMLEDLKKKHIWRKKDELETLKKRIEVLENDLRSYGIYK